MNDHLEFTTIFLIVSINIFSYLTMTRHIIANFGKYSHISQMYELPSYRKTFRLGFAGTALLQMILNVQLVLYFESNLSKIAALIFSLGSIFFALLGFIYLSERKTIHNLLIRSYAILMLIAIGLYAYDNLSEYKLLAYFHFGLIIFFIAFALRQIKRFEKKTYNLIAFHVFLSYFWLLSLPIIFL